MSLAGVKRYCLKCVQEGTFITEPNLKVAAVVGGMGHPIFYYLHHYLFNQQWKTFPLSMLAGAICWLLLTKNYWPKKYQPLFVVYWHVMLIFELPFLITLIAVKNGFVDIWPAWEIAMLFILILYVPNWLMLAIDLLIGLGLVFLWIVVFPTEPIELKINFVWYLTVVIFTLMAGFVFSRGNLKGAQAQKEFELTQKAFEIAKEKAHSIAHEMRNSLGSLIGAIDLMIQIVFKSPRNKHLPNHDILVNHHNLRKLLLLKKAAHKSHDNSNTIIDMLLRTVSTECIDENAFTVESAQSCIEDAVKSYPYKSRQEAHKVHVDIQQDFHLLVERRFLIFSLFNLIKNALYYLNDYPKSTITISADLNGAQGVIKIHDTGPGVSKDKLKSIFEGFSTSGKQGGTGLGLSFCYRSMKSFKGTIHCESKYGEYTDFILSFPTTQQRISSANKKLMTSYNSKYSVSADNKIVLLVEDNQTNQVVCKALLKSYGFKVYIANNGKQALDALSQYSIDIVLMDLQMPVMDGFTATEKIRSQQEYQQLPIIALTGNDDEKSKIAIKACGMNAHIVKPMGLSDIATIQQILTAKR